MKRSVVSSVLVLVLVLGALETAQAITNGTFDENNDYPYVGAVGLRLGGGFLQICSGAAISPKVVVTAAHCFDEEEDGIGDGDTVYVTFVPKIVGIKGGDLHKGTWHPHPDFGEGSECGSGQIAGENCRDVAVIELNKPLHSSEFASLPTEGLVDDEVPNGTEATVVGYGEDFDNSQIPKRRYAPADVISSGENVSAEHVKLTANPGGGTGGVCFGDSGGPALLGSPDEHPGNIILGVASFVLGNEDAEGVGPTCDGVTYSQRLDIEDVLDFINQFLD